MVMNTIYDFDPYFSTSRLIAASTHFGHAIKSTPLFYTSSPLPPSLCLFPVYGGGGVSVGFTELELGVTGGTAAWPSAEENHLKQHGIDGIHAQNIGLR